MSGIKLDQGKNKLGIIFRHFPLAIEQAGLVSTYGANKYGENDGQINWTDVSKSRYQDALFRHLNEYFKGNAKDEESGHHHLSHALWNLLAIVQMENEK